VESKEFTKKVTSSFPAIMGNSEKCTIEYLVPKHHLDIFLVVK
jgi:hypothetical protein